MAFLAVFASAGLFAQETTPPDTPEQEEIIPSYTLGDQMFSINLGGFFPLFYFNPVADIPSGTERVQPSNLTIGGAGALRWATFLTNELSIGAEIGGMFSFTPNDRVLFMLPLTAQVSYFFRDYPFEVPLYLGVGANFERLDDQFHVSPILKPGGSFYWNFDANWAFGANVVYWWIPQIYGDSRAGDTRIGNFFEVTLSALYHF